MLRHPPYDVDPVHHSDVTVLPGAKKGPRGPSCSGGAGWGSVHELGVYLMSGGGV